MAPINSLMCLVLMATTRRGHAASSTPATERRPAKRFLQYAVDIFPVTGKSGEKYSVELFEDSGMLSEMVIVPRDTSTAEIVVEIDEEEHITIAEQGSDMYEPTYDGDEVVSVELVSGGSPTTRRRTQHVGFPGRQLQQSCVQDCVFFIGFIFGAIRALCLNAVFEAVNQDLCDAPVPSASEVEEFCQDQCVCPNGDLSCEDPHMQGLRGQRIEWSGVDGGWYSLIKDDNADLHINVRLTAPLPEEFPDRQLMTSLAVLSKGHSVVVEVANPYTIDTDGCPQGFSPCLANGGLRIIVDGHEDDELLRFSTQVPVADGAVTLSASNLPVECRQFGGDRIWARKFQDMIEGKRQLLDGESLEEWILRYDNMAAPGWCAKYIAENELADLQSNHAIFKIETSTVTVRLNAGVNYQGNGELNWDGRVLPDLEFWQMDVGIVGLDVGNPLLSGLLGETARPVYDENGQAVMEGFDAFRGTVEDYRVSDALGVHFPLLDEKEEGHE
eukprot:g7858.t1